MRLDAFLSTTQILFFLYLASLLLVYVVLFVVSLSPFKRRSAEELGWRTPGQDTSVWMPVTVLLPAYNEEAVIVDCVKTTLGLDYPGLEVLVVCDGPKDQTFERLLEAFELFDVSNDLRSDFKTQPVLRVLASPQYPNLKVVLKKNGGKADAINVGLDAVETPLVCCCDADTLIEPGSLKRLARYFHEDSSVVAGCGALRLSNDIQFRRGRAAEAPAPKNWWAAIQVVEYVRAFGLGRMGFEKLSSMLIISGAFGMFKRTALLDVGGYNASTVGEDMEVIVRLHRHYRQKQKDYRIVYAPTAIAWTEAPELLASLRSQRMRWQRGLLEVLTLHRGLPFMKGCGAPGRFGYPFFLLFEALAPFIELIGYATLAALLLLGYDNRGVWLAMACFAAACSCLITFLSLAVQQKYIPIVFSSKAVLKLLAASFLEMLVFRPMVLFWRAKATVDFIRGKSSQWKSLERKGFNTQ